MPKAYDANHNYYADLELPPTASVDDIKKQYRKLVLQYHPDRNIGKEEEVVPKFQAISSAHEILSDAAQKAKYDADRLKPNLHVRTPAATSRPPTYGNPYQATSNFPPPPRRTQPGTFHRPGQAQGFGTAASAGPTPGPAPGPGPAPNPSGADRFSNFPRGAPTAKRTDTNQDSTNKFRAWQNLNTGQGPKSNVPPRTTFADAAASSQRQNRPQPPPRHESRFPTEEEIRAGMNHRRMPPQYSTERAEANKASWDRWQQSAPRPAGVNRAKSYHTAKKAGFDPNSPLAEEAAASAQNYSRHRSDEHGTASSVPPPPPGPPPSSVPSSPNHTRPPRPGADPLSPFKSKNDNVPYAEGNRKRTPYTSFIGEKTDTWSEGLRRSHSTRDMPASDADAQKSANRPRSTESLGHAPAAEQQPRQPSAQDQRPPFVMYSSSGSSDLEPQVSSSESEPSQDANFEPHASPLRFTPNPESRPKKRPNPPSKRFNGPFQAPQPPVSVFGQPNRANPNDGVQSETDQPSMKQKPGSHVYVSLFPSPNPSFRAEKWVERSFGGTTVPSWAFPSNLNPMAPVRTGPGTPGPGIPLQSEHAPPSHSTNPFPSLGTHLFPSPCERKSPSTGGCSIPPQCEHAPPSSSPLQSPSPIEHTSSSPGGCPVPSQSERALPSPSEHSPPSPGGCSIPSPTPSGDPAYWQSELPFPSSGGSSSASTEYTIPLPSEPSSPSGTEYSNSPWSRLSPDKPTSESEYPYADSDPLWRPLCSTSCERADLIRVRRALVRRYGPNDGDNLGLGLFRYLALLVRRGLSTGNEELDFLICSNIDCSKYAKLKFCSDEAKAKFNHRATQADEDVKSFSYPYPSHPFNTASNNKSRSEENINTKFTEGEWNGAFTGSNQTFGPSRPSSRKQRSPQRRASKPSNRVTTEPINGNYYTQAAEVPQMPTPLSPGDANGSPLSASVSAPADKNVNHAEPETQNKDTTRAWPPPPPPGGPPGSPAVSQGVRPWPSSATGDPRRGWSAEEPSVRHNKSFSNVADEHYATDSGTGRRSSTAPQSAHVEDAMDIDEAPPATPVPPPNDNNNQAQAASGAKPPRMVSVTPSAWRQSQGQSYSNNAQSSTSDSKLDNLGDLASVEPLARSAAEGLRNFADISANLPFPSQASSTLPTHPVEPQILQLPSVPRSPTPPTKLTKASWRTFAQEFASYLRAFHVFNSTMLLHFQSREVEAERMFEGGMGWLETTGDVTVQGGVSGFGKYMKDVREDQRVREAWDIACERRNEAVNEFGKTRVRVKELVASNRLLEF